MNKKKMREVRVRRYVECWRNDQNCEDEECV